MINGAPHIFLVPRFYIVLLLLYCINWPNFIHWLIYILCKRAILLYYITSCILNTKTSYFYCILYLLRVESDTYNIVKYLFSNTKQYNIICINNSTFRLLIKYLRLLKYEQTKYRKSSIAI